MNQTIEFQQNIIFSYVLVLSMYGGEVIAIGIVYALSFHHIMRNVNVLDVYMNVSYICFNILRGLL